MERRRAVTRRVRRSASRTVRACAFWTAAVLPLAYLPLLLGLGGRAGAETLLALVALHAACILVGHGHRPDRHATGGRGAGRHDDEPASTGRPNRPEGT